MKITTELLQEHDACEDQLQLFKKTFPHGAEVTVENWDKARKAGLYVRWLADVLPAPVRKEYLERLRPLIRAYAIALGQSSKAGGRWSRNNKQHASWGSFYHSSWSTPDAEHDEAVSALLFELLQKPA